MQIDTQDYLRLVENSNSICFFDIEATGLKGDYNTILVVSVKPYHSDPVSFNVSQIGNDQKVIREAGEFLNEFDCWVTYYGKGFDVPMINTRKLKWGQEPLAKKHHLDMFFTLKSKTVMARKSMAQFAGLLELHDQKMGVSPNVWTEVLGNPSGKAMKTMIERCESDCAVLQQLYDKTKHLVYDLKKG